MQLLSFSLLVHPAPLSGIPLCPTATLSGRSGGHEVASVIRLRRMNCYELCRAFFAGWPASSHGASKLSTDPRGKQRHL